MDFSLRKPFVFLRIDARRKTQVRFAFGNHLLDTERRELYRDRERVALEPRVFDLLLNLVTNRDRVVSKDDLITDVWRGRVVSDAALTTALNAARTAVGDSGAAQHVIRTVPRRGVRFVAEVIEERGREPVPLRPAPALALPDKPSIAVLPFQNLSSEPEQDYFADGVVEEITTALSRIRWLFVIARNSSFAYKGRTIDIKQVGRELGVRYVLEGSIRKSGSRVRITAQLIDAQDATHLWADRFDGSLEDVFDLQDEVATRVALVIEPTLEAAEIRRAAQRPTTDLTAYDLYWRALQLHNTFTYEGITKALELFYQAIARDPNYGAALARASICHERLRHDGWSLDPEDDHRKAVTLAKQAIEASPSDASALANAAFVLAFSKDHADGVAAIVDRALTINPSFARGWYVSAIIRSRAGCQDEAIEHANRAIRLSPHERSGPFLGPLGCAYFWKRDFATAIGFFFSLAQEYPSFTETYRFLAAAYAHLGRLGEARATLDRLRTMTSLIMPPHLDSIRRPEDRELLLSGVSLALGDNLALAK
jgi:TolB-like protein